MTPRELVLAVVGGVLIRLLYLAVNRLLFDGVLPSPSVGDGFTSLCVIVLSYRLSRLVDSKETYEVDTNE
jgi:hypothetical protein